ncbi:MAG: hypothetical protein MJE68_04510 [Proteobacteria bacterium]|nr:hypothetical protein [Pseudomonadota bacterium]
MGGEYPSLHHNSELTLADHQPGPVSTKELVSIMREDSKITAAGYGAAGGGTCSFPTRSPTTSTLHHPLPQFSSMISELDPSLEHLLGGTVSPAVASTPSPNTTTTTAAKISRSPIASSFSPPPPIPPMSSIPPTQQLHRYFDASEEDGEIMTDIVCDGEGKEEECPETVSVGVVAAAGGGDDDQELVEDLNEMVHHYSMCII